MLCYVMYICYVIQYMLNVMLYNKCYVVLYNMCYVILCYVIQHMLCHVI